MRKKTEIEKIKAKAYREAHREEAKIYARKYRREKGSTRDKERQKRIIEEWRKKNPERRIAHHRVYKAVKKGILVKKPCIVCGEIKVHAHHEDYTKPLEVIWLCPIHHWQYDNERRIKEKST